MSPHETALPARPPEAWEPGLRLALLAARPLERFLQVQASSGILLLVTSLVAFVWAGSPWRDSYVALWETPVGITFGDFSFQRSLRWLVDDGLMTVFFFVVGLEIRREIAFGELSELKRAALPVVAALGGMIAPALLYLAMAGNVASRGWGVPMATDIAFALGVLALLGPRVPPALRVLLLALAVIDDLGAIVVIAVFYSEGLAGAPLGVAVLAIASIFALQSIGVRRKLVYVVPSIVAWAAVYAAGVHPTIAGVVVGLVTPVRAWLGPSGFVREAPQILEALAAEAQAETHDPHVLAGKLAAIDHLRREAMSPAESLIETLHPWVAFVIMPIFALANAGVALDLDSLGAQGTQIGVAVGVALWAGKLAGIFGASWIAIRVGLARCPRGISSRHLIVLGLVAGIGFTMALFVAGLAFEDPGQLGAAKLGVFAGSLVAGGLALSLGRWLLPAEREVGIAESADEAERSTEL